MMMMMMMMMIASNHMVIIIIIIPTPTRSHSSLFLVFVFNPQDLYYRGYKKNNNLLYCAKFYMFVSNINLQFY